MQKAVIVRAVTEGAAGFGWSFEVDAQDSNAESPLKHLLEDGWKVIHTCPMPSELDSSCLVVLEKDGPSGPEDVGLAELHHAETELHARARILGPTIPLDRFRTKG